jgi:hypothetical protein
VANLDPEPSRRQLLGMLAVGAAVMLTGCASAATMAASRSVPKAMQD